MNLTQLEIDKTLQFIITLSIYSHSPQHWWYFKDGPHSISVFYSLSKSLWNYIFFVIIASSQYYYLHSYPLICYTSSVFGNGPRLRYVIDLLKACRFISFAIHFVWHFLYILYIMYKKPRDIRQRIIVKIIFVVFAWIFICWIPALLLPPEAVSATMISSLLSSLLWLYPIL